MPFIVKLTGYASLAASAMLALIFALNMGSPAPTANPDDLQFDLIAVPFGLILSLSGVAASAGVLLRSTLAYRVLVAGLTAVVIVLAAVSMATLATSKTNAAAGAVGAGALGYLIHSLRQEPVRDHFGLPKHDPDRWIRVLAWSSMASPCLLLFDLVAPRPLAFFGMWLPPQANMAINFGLVVGSVYFGIALLRKRPAARGAIVILSVLTTIYAAGTAWNPNPQGRLGADEATPPEAATLGLLLVLVCSIITCGMVFRWSKRISRGT